MPPLRANAFANVRVTLCGRQISLRRCRTDPAQGSQDRQAEMFRQILRLVESASAKASSMQRDWNDDMRVDEHITGVLLHQMAQWSSE